MEGREDSMWYKDEDFGTEDLIKEELYNGSIVTDKYVNETFSERDRSRRLDSSLKKVSMCNS
jgi:hypothetical protein